MTLPSYSELLRRGDAPPGSSWGLFPDSPELGTLNFQRPETIRGAANLVRRGNVFNLDFALDAFASRGPHPVQHRRAALTHTITSNGRDHRDDFVSPLYLQASTHIDGLRHVRHPQFGFYGGVPDDAIDVGTEALGVQVWARAGIVGRGVLADVARHRLRIGTPPLDHAAGEPFGVDEIDAALTAQGVEVRPGDILLIRTGWAEWYLNDASEQERGSLQKQLRSSGLVQATETVAWLWDHRISVVAADNIPVECIPAVPSSPFVEGPAAEGIGPGYMHPILIGLLGFVIGELWSLQELASDCASDGTYEFLLVAKPLHLVGGVGSPANALAIK